KSRARPAGRDHAVADHALPRLLAAAASRRLRRARHRGLRALHLLERPAVDLGSDAAAGHLLLGFGDLSHRRIAVSVDRRAAASVDREVEGLSALAHRDRDRAGYGDNRRGAFRLGVRAALFWLARLRSAAATAHP